MRLRVIAQVLSLFALVACGSAPEAADLAGSEEAAASRAVDIAPKLVGPYENPFASASGDARTLKLRKDGSYEIELVSGTHETGTFTATQGTKGAGDEDYALVGTLKLKPKRGTSRTYGVKVAGDFSAIELARRGATVLFQGLGVVECFKDEDCGAGVKCDFGDDGKTCGAPVVTNPHPGDPATCGTRTGGAFVTIEVAGEKLTVWSTNDAFIDTAKAGAHGPSGNALSPNFTTVYAGTDCDAKYTWHVEPSTMSWEDVHIEQCDGRPSYVEENLATWMHQVKRYCPWDNKVVGVDDRR